jgi:hypothetical protein
MTGAPANRKPADRIAEPIPPTELPDPIIRHENGGWAVWHDAERFPSHAFARASWLRRTRHDPSWGNK